jgi:hypothetical protein
LIQDSGSQDESSEEETASYPNSLTEEESSEDEESSTISMAAEVSNPSKKTLPKMNKLIPAWKLLFLKLWGIAPHTTVYSDLFFH